MRYQLKPAAVWKTRFCTAKAQ